MLLALVDALQDQCSCEKFEGAAHRETFLSTMRNAFTGGQKNGAAKPALTLLFERRKCCGKVC
jgi:hypothetical protein